MFMTSIAPVLVIGDYDLGQTDPPAPAKTPDLRTNNARLQ